jgi:hypothetical protein
MTLDARDEACHLGLIEACIELGRSQDDAQAAYLRCIDRLPAAPEPAFGAAM